MSSATEPSRHCPGRRCWQHCDLLQLLLQLLHLQSRGEVGGPAAGEVPQPAKDEVAAAAAVPILPAPQHSEVAVEEDEDEADEADSRRRVRRPRRPRPIWLKAHHADILYFCYRSKRD